MAPDAGILLSRAIDALKQERRELIERRDFAQGKIAALDALIAVKRAELAQLQGAQ